jgi:hypothetical protein
VAKDPRNPTRARITDDWCIVEGLERDHGVVKVVGARIDIKLVRYAIQDDWAVLERIDEQTFPETDVLEICDIDEIPSRRGSMKKLTVFQCALDMFNNGMNDAVMCVSSQAMFGYSTGHKVFLQTALFGGSSGGIYAFMSNGRAKVLAMHVESVSRAKSISGAV